LTGHHHAHEVRVDPERGAQQGQAVHPWHHQIGEQHVERLFSQCRQRLLRHGKSGDVVSLRRERAAEGFHLSGFVVHDEQARAHRHAY
jgi:hypothetical protein